MTNLSLLCKSDYYPFGLEIASRSESQQDYRYGFNGMEKDDEIVGTGNSLDFGARMYDNRLGRWKSTDPYEGLYPYLSSYQYAANSPILLLDYDGKKISKSNKEERGQWKKLKSELKKTSSGREQIRFLKKASEIIHIRFTNNILIFANGTPGSGKIVEGATVSGMPVDVTTYLGDDRTHATIIISEGVGSLEREFLSESGKDWSWVNRLDKSEVDAANIHISDLLTDGTRTFEIVPNVVAPRRTATIVSTGTTTTDPDILAENQIGHRIASRYLGKRSASGEWENAPAERLKSNGNDWSIELERSTTPLTGEDTGEFMSRVAVHEIEHVRTILRMNIAIALGGLARDLNMKQQETPSYKKEAKQIKEQKQNRASF